MKPRYAADEEAIVLKSYLDSEIKDDVSSLGDDVVKIWERLDSKYGDTGKVIDSIMYDVKNLTKCEDGDLTGILEMINIIERANRDLSALNMLGEMNNSTIVSLIEQVLPKCIEDDWLDIITGTCEEESIRENKFTELLKQISFHTTFDSIHSGQPLLLLQRIPVKKTSRQRSEINCLWDTGSTISLITFKAIQKLGLSNGVKTNLTITKVGGITEHIISQKFEIKLISGRNRYHPVSVLAIDTISSEIQSVNMNELVLHFNNLKKISVNRPISSEVDCLFVMDVAGYHPIRIDATEHLLLMQNEFGLVIGGYHRNIKEKTTKSILNVCINLTITRFEDTENIGIECKAKCGSCRCGKCHPGGLNMTLEEKEEYHLVEKGLTFNDDSGRWLAKYPCKRDFTDLPNNRDAIIKGFHSLERRFARDPEYAGIYEEQINDMIRRNVCRKVTDEEIDEYQGPIFYLPHHLVKKMESKSTPYRLVFNTSAEYLGHILNEYYAKGPSMLNNILGLLLIFVQYRVAICGDISKMYHSIDIPIVDQMIHLFLWRKDPSEEISTYAMTTVNFGDKPSGCMATAALQKTADKNAKEFPEVCKIIKKNSYMDDVPHSTQSEQGAEKIMKGITYVVAKGGFK